MCSRWRTARFNRSLKGGRSSIARERAEAAHERPLLEKLSPKPPAKDWIPMQVVVDAEDLFACSKLETLALLHLEPKNFRTGRAVTTAELFDGNHREILTMLVHPRAGVAEELDELASTDRQSARAPTDAHA
jgi:hypothetical protein